jgi:hypothetical protein
MKSRNKSELFFNSYKRYALILFTRRCSGVIDSSSSASTDTYTRVQGAVPTLLFNAAPSQSYSTIGRTLVAVDWPPAPMLIDRSCSGTKAPRLSNSRGISTLGMARISFARRSPKRRFLLGVLWRVQKLSDLFFFFISIFRGNCYYCSVTVTPPSSRHSIDIIYTAP